jgi:hypothetical protein
MTADGLSQLKELDPVVKELNPVELRSEIELQEFG